jgi:hypothetical protein
VEHRRPPRLLGHQAGQRRAGPTPGASCGWSNPTPASRWGPTWRGSSR